MDNKTIVNEIRRRQKKVKFLCALWIVISLGSFGCIVAGFLALAAKYTFLGILLGVAGIAGQLYRYKGNCFEEDAKTELKNYIGEYVVKDIIAERLEIIEYAPSSMMDRKELPASGIMPGYDRITGSDYIKGIYKGHKIEYCDLHLEDEVEGDEDSSSYWVTVFQGPFIRIPLGKELKGYVKIKERKSAKKKKGIMKDLFGSVAKSLGLDSGESIVELENVAFNEQFEVRTTNEELAFYILTPQFMENIVGADKYAQGYTNISFKEGAAYIALNNGRDSFEISKNMYSVKQLEKSRQEMKQDMDRLTKILDEIFEKEQLFRE